MPTDAKKWLQEQIDSGAIPDNDGHFHYGECFSDVIKCLSDVIKQERKCGKNEGLS